ncbi:hypothetical protein FOA52_004852 [Chlamydomonas sp. UWO 241]|nr:hypothetical protein FOA52_004852 [Chlamydomonas sp. UWO 241]
MAVAIQQARVAALAGEVPVGAALLDASGRVVAAAHNETVARTSPLAHAEMLVLEAGARALGAWRLLDCTLYVTCEPCPMCAGAVLQARLKRLVYGARQPRIGADGSWVSLFPPEEEEGSSGADGADASGGGRARGRGRSGACVFRTVADDGVGSSGPGAQGEPERQRRRRLQQAREAHVAAAQLEGCPCCDAADSRSVLGPGGPISPLGPHPFHPGIRVTRGVGADECAGIMREFFAARRRERTDASVQGRRERRAPCDSVPSESW